MIYFSAVIIMKPVTYFGIITIWALCVIGYGFYALSGIVFIVSIVPLAVLLKPFHTIRLSILNGLLFSYLRFLTRIFIPFLRIYSFREISGRHHIPADTPAVFIANHQGALDAPLLLGLLRNTVAVIKSRYASKIIYSRLVTYFNFISIDAGSLGRIEQALRQAQEALSHNRNILIFPEGTRSNTGRLLPFKEFAFKIAQEQRVPVVPVVIYSSIPFMTKTAASFFPKKKFFYTVRFLAPFFTSPGQHPTDIAAQTRKMMMKELQTIEETMSDSSKGISHD